MVEPEHSTEPLATIDRAAFVLVKLSRLDEGVSQPLVVALPVIVFDVSLDRAPERGVAHEDHAIEALGFYGTHIALGECVQIRTSCRKSHRLDAHRLEDILERLGVERIPIVEKIPLPREEPGMR